MLFRSRSGALLVGAPGLGKTLLIRTLARQLPAKEFPFVQLLFPQLAPSELVAYITEELTGVQPLGTPTDRYLRRLQGHLAEIAREGKHLVLVFEEAHLLRESSNLETIRLLMNFEHQAVPAMTARTSARSASVSAQPAAATLERTWAGDVQPAITVDTTGFDAR